MKRAEIEALLPDVFRRTVHQGAPLLAILEVMATLPAPDEDILTRLPDYFNPYRTPEEFTAFLARWVDLDRLLSDGADPTADILLEFPGGLGRLRDLIAAAAQLSRWRGTRRGLMLFLELATGVSGFQVEEQPPDEAGRSRPFHLCIHAPAAARPYHALIQQIIEQEKPVYVTHELAYEQGG